MALTVWQERTERARAALANFKEKVTGTVAIVTRAGVAAGAAGVAGAVRGTVEAAGKDYSLPVPGSSMRLPPELPAGGLLLAIAASGKAGKVDMTDNIAAAGIGILAYSAGREAENYMRKKGTKTPGAVQ